MITPAAPLDPSGIAARMDGVLRPSTHGAGVMEAFLPSPCLQNHAANLTLLPNGDLACVWFGGTMEGLSDISVYMSRLPAGGDRWLPPLRLSDDPARSEQNPLLFPAPDGRLILFHTAQPAGNQNEAFIRMRVSHDGGESFGPPTLLAVEPGTFVRQRPVVDGRGDWLLPVFFCRTPAGHPWRGDDDSSGVLVSPDGGRTWDCIAVPGSLGAVHMNIAPIGGTDMVAVYRSRWADNVYLSTSVDDGLNWTAPQPLTLPNNNSSIQMTALRSGALALVYNHSSAADASERRISLYDEIGEGSDEAPSVAALAPPSGRSAFWGAPRSPLSLSLSADAGRSWAEPVHLETGSGYCLTNNSQDKLNRELSYPSIHEDDEGALHIAFTYYRQAIKYLRIPNAAVMRDAETAPASPGIEAK